MKALPDPHKTETRHPIAVVAERTGLSQDVLRVWERRYGAVYPERRAGGQRLYTDADIERLVLLRAATRAGRSIGHVARLSTAAVASLVEDDRAANARRSATALPPDAEDVLGASLALALALDAPVLDETLRRAAARLGMSVFLESVAAPLLRRCGEEWHAGRMTPAQEHLVTSTLNGMVVETIRAFAQQNGAPRVLVATLARDRHVIGAALAGAAAAVEGWSVLHLGGDLPANEIADAARAAGVGVVAVSVIYVEDRDHVLGELRALRSRLPTGTVLIAGGAGAASLVGELSAMGVRVASSVPGLLTELRRERTDE